MRADAGKWGPWSLEGDDKKFRRTRNAGWGGDREDGEEAWCGRLNRMAFSTSPRNKLGRIFFFFPVGQIGKRGVFWRGNGIPSGVLEEESAGFKTFQREGRENNFFFRRLDGFQNQKYFAKQ